MREFNLELAKAGAKVQTRDGRPARIICYDRKAKQPIIALVLEEDNIEHPYTYYNDGKGCSNAISNLDLVIVFTKKEGWINIYKNCDGKVRIGYTYQSETNALENIGDRNHYICTKKIEWEE